MLFFKKEDTMYLKKQTQDLMKQVEQLRRQSDKISGRQEENASKLAQLLEQQEEMVEQTSVRLDEMAKRNEGYEKTIRRQADSFEDFLEMEKDQTEERQAWARKEQEHERTEEALVQLACFLLEQMELTKGLLKKSEQMDDRMRQAWELQFQTISQELEKYMRSCGLEQVGKTGETIDYAVHEILNTLPVPAEDDRANGTVAEVYSSGFIYHGHVVRKARVSAYVKNTN